LFLLSHLFIYLFWGLDTLSLFPRSETSSWLYLLTEKMENSIFLCWTFPLSNSTLFWNCSILKNHCPLRLTFYFVELKFYYFVLSSLTWIWGTILNIICYNPERYGPNSSFTKTTPNFFFSKNRSKQIHKTFPGGFPQTASVV
jgi:hypothetical protein